MIDDEIVNQTISPTDDEMSLPEGWRLVQLNTLCEHFTRTRDPRKTPNDPFHYVDITSVDNQAKRILETRLIFGKDAPSRARQVIHENDVIVATTRPNLNAVALVSKNLDNQICSTGFCVLRSTAELDAQYLFSFVRSELFVDSLSSLVKGAMYPAVTDKQVKSQVIPLPTTIEEQRRIASILDEQMKAVEKARVAVEEQLKAANCMPTAYMRSVFEGEAATRWKVRKLGDIFRLQSGSFLSAKQMSPNGQYPVYGGNGINGFHDKYIFDEPKIVIGRVGAKCGSIHISESKSWITDNALYVSEKIEPFDDQFLAAFLEYRNLNQLSNSMAQPLVSGKVIYPLEVSLPEIDEQTRITESLREKSERAKNLSRILKAKLGAINCLPAALLRNAFAGDI